ncbi:MAG: HTH domain-containing protein [Cyanobacteria bacterium P01_D01_bin.44]
MLLKLSNEIEELAGEEDIYQVRFECLPSAAEKAFRVLKENGNPLHFSEIAKIINQAELNQGKGSRITVTNLKNQLIADDRFNPIGRSGIWSLSEWENISTKTITQIMEDSFHERGEPISAKEVYQYVISKRPDASFRSVSVYLSNADVFVRVDKNQYALVVWGLKSISKSIRRTPDEASSLIREALKEIFVDKDSMRLADLVRQVKEKTSLAEMTVRTRVKKSRNFELKQDGNSNNYTVYCINRNFGKTNLNMESSKELLRDKIQNEITSILQANPNAPITKGDLYFLVKKEVDCIRPTFYAYLSEMDDIKQYTDSGKSYCVYEYHEQYGSVDIDPALLDSCSDAELLKRLKRAINKLNIDEVDLGLFELGRIFENELKDYLLIAKQNSVIQVYRKDLERLVRMIDCVVRENVVSKGYYLHILREERNERAHGKIPNLDERKVILNKAHYIAELYVQSIIFFNSKKSDILQRFANTSSA